MTLSPHALERRQNYLTASDAAAVLGISPWATAADVYWRKLAPVAPEPEDRGGEVDARDAGDIGEGLLRGISRRRLRGRWIKNQFRVHTGRILAATYDDIERAVPKRAAEFKTSGLLRTLDADKRGNWGTPGTDEVPQFIIPQCLVQLAVTPSLDEVHVPAFLEWGLKWYLIRRTRETQEKIDELTAYLESWWRRHYIARVPPEGGEVPPLEIMARLERRAEPTIWLDNAAQDAVAEWEACKAAAKLAKDEEDAAKARVLALLGVPGAEAHEAGWLPDGRVLRYAEQSTGARLDAAKLKLEEPEVFKRYAREGTTRVLRVVKGGKK